jgi:hypothetical protein
LEDECNEDVEDQDAESSEEDDEDEVDPSVEASDNAMIDKAAAEADAELPALTRAEVNLGRLRLPRYYLVGELYMIANSYVDS